MQCKETNYIYAAGNQVMHVGGGDGIFPKCNVIGKQPCQKEGGWCECNGICLQEGLGV